MLTPEHRLECACVSRCCVALLIHYCRHSYLASQQSSPLPSLLTCVRLLAPAFWLPPPPLLLLQQPPLQPCLQGQAPDLTPAGSHLHLEEHLQFRG